MSQNIYIDMNHHLDECMSWLVTQCTQEIFSKIHRTYQHYRENQLGLYISVDEPNEKLSVVICGSDVGEPKDPTESNYNFFDFYRSQPGTWRFGVNTDDELMNHLGQEISLTGQGYSRFMMALLLYIIIERRDILPIDSTALFQDIDMSGDDLRIIIVADASEGYWSYIGMFEGKYSMDGSRYNTRVDKMGADKEFTMREWKRWVFTGTKKASLRKQKKKTTKKKKPTKKQKKSTKKKKPTKNKKQTKKKKSTKK